MASLKFIKRFSIMICLFLELWTALMKISSIWPSRSKKKNSASTTRSHHCRHSTLRRPSSFLSPTLLPSRVPLHLNLWGSCCLCHLLRLLWPPRTFTLLHCLRERQPSLIATGERSIPSLPPTSNTGHQLLSTARTDTTRFHRRAGSLSEAPSRPNNLGNPILNPNPRVLPPCHFYFLWFFITSFNFSLLSII